MNPASFLQELGSIAILLTTFGSFGLWIIRNIVRSETKPFKHDLNNAKNDIIIIKSDVADLKKVVYSQHK